jgi:hypothetical protein
MRADPAFVAEARKRGDSFQLIPIRLVGGSRVYHSFLIRVLGQDVDGQEGRILELLDRNLIVGRSRAFEAFEGRFSNRLRLCVEIALCFIVIIGCRLEQENKSFLDKRWANTNQQVAVLERRIPVHNRCDTRIPTI